MFDLDAYDRGARLAPAYLVFSPAVVFVVALSLGTSAWWSKIGGVLVGCGAPALAVQWGRSGGRQKQPALWAKWGGPPTTKLLRFAEGGSAVAVAQRHEAIERAAGIKMPTSEQEAADRATADTAYETGVEALRALTDDGKQFPLVLKENIAYGFRRNLWGRKPYGVGTAIIVLAISAALLIVAAFGHALGSWPASAAAAVFAGVTLLIWLTMVNEEWVHEAADSYATRLMQTALRLPPKA